jgi:hypothetical protein
MHTLRLLFAVLLCAVAVRGAVPARNMTLTTGCAFDDCFAGARGNCTGFPATCDCESGFAGAGCEQSLCTPDCLNDALCVDGGK